METYINHTLLAFPTMLLTIFWMISLDTVVIINIKEILNHIYALKGLILIYNYGAMELLTFSIAICSLIMLLVLIIIVSIVSSDIENENKLLEKKEEELYNF